MKASIGALLIGLGSVGYACGQFAPAPPAIGGPLPSAAQPGGAQFFSPAKSNVPGSGAYFHGVNAPIPSPVGLQPAPAVATPAMNPSLPAPQALPAREPMPPVFQAPMPPISPPFVMDEMTEPIPGAGMAEPYTGFGRGAGFPAMGAWGAGTSSGEFGPHLWMSADYLFWWVKNGPMPQPLVATGSAADDFPGALDQLNTTVLYGGKGINYNPFSGARVSVGLWGGADHRFGFEMSGFILEQKATKFVASGGATGNPFLARPFINAQTGAENVYFVSQNFADPERSALMTGSIEISNSSRMWSWETNALWNVWRGPNATANLLGGFRSVGLRERFSVSESLQNVAAGGGVYFGGASVDPGSIVTTYDKFDAENAFYGGQLGARILLQHGRFSLNLSGKAALGVVQQLVAVDGGTVVRNGIPGSDGRGLITGSAQGGVLAQSTNIGRHFQNKFAIVPEGAADLCIDITDRLVVKLGYTFVYLSSVARPGDQIDRTINPGVVPTDFDYGTGGANRPSFQFKTSSVWTQGANLGVEFRY